MCKTGYQKLFMITWLILFLTAALWVSPAALAQSEGDAEAAPPSLPQLFIPLIVMGEQNVKMSTATVTTEAVDTDGALPKVFLPLIAMDAQQAVAVTPAVSAAANQPIDAEAARTQILAGVTSLANPTQPGHMVVYGATAYSVANYKSRALGDPMIAVASLGAGKVIALPDHQWLNMNSFGNIGTTGQFYLNSIAWLAGTTDKSIKIVVTPHAAARTWLLAQGFTNVIQSGNYTTDLPGASLLIGWLGSSETPANLDAIATYARNGGSLFLAEFGIGYKWWWGQPVTQAPGNLLLREAGIGFTHDWPYSGSTDLDPTNRAVGQLTSDDVLNNMNRVGSYTAQQRADTGLMVRGLFQILSTGDPLLVQLEQTASQWLPQLNPTLNTQVSDKVDQAMLYWEGLTLQKMPVAQVNAHRLAATLYGSVPANTPRVNQTVTINTGKSRWQPTGLFLVPGEIATVIVPAALVGQGYQIRINAHTDDISGRSSWERPPLVHRTFAIDQANMQIASHFGGLLFIDLGSTPPNLGNQVLTIQNVVEAPYFVLGQHSDTEWLTSLRNRPAPYANLVADNLIITLRSAEIATLQEPTALMTWWNQVVALQDDLSGQSRSSAELMNIDVQNSVGAAHSGYPYQAWDRYWDNPADWNKLQVTGSWGDFHELGHNHQQDWWTFDEDGEVTVNIFSNYNLETLNPNATGGWSWSNDPVQVIQEAKKNVQVGGTYASKANRWSFWFQLADGFGWHTYRQLFHQYEADQRTNPALLPTTEQAKKDQWLVRWSNAVGYDMTRFMRDTWGLEVSQSAVDQISALPDWMPLVGGIKSATVTQNSAYLFAIAANAYAMDGVANLIDLSQPAYGTLVNQGNGNYLYTPAAGYVGADSFVYTLQSSAGNTQSFTVTLSVRPDLVAWLPFNDNTQDATGNNNHATIAGSVPFVSGTTGQAISLNGVPSNYLSFGTPSDLNVANGEDFSVAFWIKSSGWTLNQDPVIIGNKNWASGSNTGWAIIGRTDGKSWKWNYRASGTARLDFNGGVINDNRWHHIAITHDRDGNATFYQDGVVLGSLSLAANQGSLISGLPTVIGQDGTRLYPYGMNAQLDEIRFYRRVLSAGEVGQLQQTNQPPVANPDAATTNEDTAVTLTLVSNDSDPDGDALTLTSVGSTANGSVVNNGNNSVTYTPAANYSGADSFTYTISDGKGGTAVGTVHVTVSTVNDAPVAVNDSSTTNEESAITINVLSNDSDSDGNALVVDSVSPPAHGATMKNADNSITYTPAANYNGTDSFSYIISDGQGSNATATVNVTINAVNDAPVAGNDSGATNEDNAVTINVLSNDSDVDGNALSVSSVSAPAHGTAVTNADNTITYTPAADYNGADAFSYTISDGQGGTATAFVDVTVSAVNDTPLAGNDTASTNQNSATTITVLNNDRDPDGNLLSVSSVSQPAHGVAAKNADDSITYTPAANYIGADSFTYLINDGQGGSATGTVNVTVTSSNRNPVANNDSAVVLLGSNVTIVVLSNDSDPDGDVLTISNVSIPGHGAAEIGNNGIVYTPSNGYVGSDSFNYTVSDSKGGTASANVTVTVVDPINLELRTYLRLNNDSLDSSGSNNHATIRGTVPFVTGLNGQAVSLNGVASNYLSFGTPSDLNIANGEDFSVAFWIKSSGWSLNQDPVIIGNKNWASGSNTGWVIAGRTDGKSWKWNYRASGTSRRDFNGGVINDNKWHHIAITHDRDGNATFYQDGVVLGSLSLAASGGSLISGLPTNVGQDGTGAYPYGLNAQVDEIRIYRRVLSTSEVNQLMQSAALTNTPTTVTAVAGESNATPEEAG